MGEQRAGGGLIDQRGIAQRRMVGAEEPLVDQLGELGGRTAHGQVAQRRALVGGVRQVSIDDVACQHIHVVGDVERRGLVDNGLQIGQFSGSDRAVVGNAGEDLDHVLPADRAVGVQALHEVSQRGVVPARTGLHGDGGRARDRAALGRHRATAKAVGGREDSAGTDRSRRCCSTRKSAAWPSPS